MMFFVDIAFAMEIIALSFGGALLIFAKMNKNVKTGFAKFIAAVVMILAVLSMICTSYYTVKYWKQGAFEKPNCMKKQIIIKNKSS